MKPTALLLLLATILITGCVSPTTVDYDRTAKAKINSYKCFVIDSREERSNYQDIVLSPIVDRRIEQALSRTLQAKGMNQGCAEPDFRVTFNTITKTKTEVNDLGVGPTPFRRYPYHGYGAFSRIDINQYEEGTFIVDIIDQASKELVWRGTYTQRLGWSAPNDEKVQQIVSDILVNFPPHSE
ncbi:MAG TPA: hypothetical protein DEA90_08490 [Opitutae bacterium]|nr:hypothetical protein [Puniceicoccaceae bacterium]HBR94187.1 hypothetical protein [Opitutae bacterium]|tara:strand:+ start:28350 stop:28898 length:549 start_codon:yes stop_codon:yes gene_type:complete